MIQVVDASVVVDMLLDKGESGEWCRDRVTEGNLAEPHLMQIEAGNLIRRSAARGVVDLSMAQWALQRVVWLPLELLPFDILAGRAWDLRENLTVYDACYVAAAERLGARLVTLDRKMTGVPGLRCEVLVGPVGTQ